ncbi:hypothetical protein Hanom_Chr04g00377981 [Helianthus anomalus]
MIMGASTSSFWYNLRVQHPCREVPIFYYDLALLFQPMLMLGITHGVALSGVFSYWLIDVLIIILFLGTSSRSFFRGIEMWKEESILKKEMAKSQETFANSRGEFLIDTFEPLIPKEEKTQKEVFTFNFLQVIKNDLVACSTWYWVFIVAQFSATLAVFGSECVKLYKERKRRKSLGNTKFVCEATIN